MKKPLALDPSAVGPQVGLGDILYKKGRYEAAADRYLAGLEADPENPEAREGLKRAEAKMRQTGALVSAEYIAKRLDAAAFNLPGGNEPESGPRMAFQNILFDFDSADIQTASHPQLDEMGKALAVLLDKRGGRVVLEGHTDDRGDPAYNVSLSQRRAEAVKAYLVEKTGLTPDRVVALGLGAARPAGPNDTDEGRARKPKGRGGPDRITSGPPRSGPALVETSRWVYN